ncbi:peroxidase 3 [Populus alba x Populus x berolinensis]|uniref:Peroxidase 3 n=1 Tax=Populus alba x Populus x berolinensis TaxID=444605 RepID=A0AAD6LTP0_9ROSI|nr:peroxidase 3 [Populus alba x Populus x berolinensis]
MLHAGGHTIGAGHRNLVSNRLYNFTGKGDEDPSLNPTYVAFLKNPNAKFLTTQQPR